MEKEENRKQDSLKSKGNNLINLLKQFHSLSRPGLSPFAFPLDCEIYKDKVSFPFITVSQWHDRVFSTKANVNEFTF